MWSRRTGGYKYKASHIADSYAHEWGVRICRRSSNVSVRLIFTSSPEVDVMCTQNVCCTLCTVSAVGTDTVLGSLLMSLQCVCCRYRYRTGKLPHLDSEDVNSAFMQSIAPKLYLSICFAILRIDLCWMKDILMLLVSTGLCYSNCVLVVVFQGVVNTVFYCLYYTEHRSVNYPSSPERHLEYPWAASGLTPSLVCKCNSQHVVPGRICEACCPWTGLVWWEEQKI